MIDTADEVTRHRASLGPTTGHFVGAGHPSARARGTRVPARSPLAGTSHGLWDGASGRGRSRPLHYDFARSIKAPGCPYK